MSLFLLYCSCYSSFVFPTSLTLSLSPSLFLSLSVFHCSIKLDMLCLCVYPCLYIAHCISIHCVSLFLPICGFYPLHALYLLLSVFLCFYLPISFFLSLLCASSLFSEYYFVNLVYINPSSILTIFIACLFFFLMRRST